jgi:signal transduction histidine kinase/ActR/RegA family two-component response regulator
MTEKHMNAYFDNAEISIWIEDHSNIYDSLRRLREEGITDIRKYLDENEQAAWNMAAQIQIKKVNRATLKLFDANSSDEFISNIDDTFGPGAIEVFKQQICAVWEKKKSFRAEVQFRTLEGREIFCIISLPIPNTKNEFTNVPISIIDITVRKQLEKQLQHTQKMDAIDQLTGGIAHDYNNILGIVQGNFEILRHMLAGNEKAIERIKAGLLGAKRGADLTRKLLNFSTTSISGTKLVSVSTLVNDITDLIAKSLTVSVKVNIRLDDDIWMVRIDPGDLQDALINLAINARDAMPEGGQLTIEIKNKTLNEKYSKLNQQALSGEYVMIAVSDTGHGMTPEIQERILEPFFTTKGRNEGSGLGLSMVYGFVQRSGGQLRIHSEVDKGSVFQIYLPRRVIQDRDVPENEVAEISLLTGSEVILIVDDEVDLSDIAQAYLQDLGYKTVVAENGFQALEILRSRSDIDLMFTDVVMPGEIDGYKLVLKAHELHPKLRILLTSGYAKRPDKLSSDEDFVVRQLSNNLLSKPYNESDVSLAVRQALDGPPIDLRVDA